MMGKTHVTGWHNAHHAARLVHHGKSGNAVSALSRLCIRQASGWHAGDRIVIQSPLKTLYAPLHQGLAAQCWASVGDGSRPCAGLRHSNRHARLRGPYPCRAGSSGTVQRPGFVVTRVARICGGRKGHDEGGRNQQHISNVRASRNSPYQLQGNGINLAVFYFTDMPRLKRPATLHFGPLLPKAVQKAGKRYEPNTGSKGGRAGTLPFVRHCHLS